MSKLRYIILFFAFLFPLSSLAYTTSDSFCVAGAGTGVVNGTYSFGFHSNDVGADVWLNDNAVRLFVMGGGTAMFTLADSWNTIYRGDSVDIVTSVYTVEEFGGGDSPAPAVALGACNGEGSHSQTATSTDLSTSTLKTLTDSIYMSSFWSMCIFLFLVFSGIYNVLISKKFYE